MLKMDLLQESATNAMNVYYMYTVRSKGSRTEIFFTAFRFPTNAIYRAVIELRS
jgi:hypothetical protein